VAETMAAPQSGEISLKCIVAASPPKVEGVAVVTMVPPKSVLWMRWLDEGIAAATMVRPKSVLWMLWLDERFVVATWFPPKNDLWMRCLDERLVLANE
jgi:hypothetical protein